MKKSENITTDVIVRICDSLNCDINEIMELVNDEIIDYVIESTNKYIEQMPKKIRKKKWTIFYEQKKSALFMASLFDFIIIFKRNFYT